MSGGTGPARLEPLLVARHIQCVRVPLDELFIELAGHKHKVVRS
jgi:hypothetical protein